MSRPTLAPTQPPNQWVPGALYPGVNWPGREADNSPTPSGPIHLHGMVSFKHGAILPFLTCASVFDPPRAEKCTGTPSVSHVSRRFTAKYRNSVWDFINNSGYSDICRTIFRNKLLRDPAKGDIFGFRTPLGLSLRAEQHIKPQTYNEPVLYTNEADSNPLR